VRAPWHTECDASFRREATAVCLVPGRAAIDIDLPLMVNEFASVGSESAPIMLDRKRPEVSVLAWGASRIDPSYDLPRELVSAQ